MFNFWSDINKASTNRGFVVFFNDVVTNINVSCLLQPNDLKFLLSSRPRTELFKYFPYIILDPLYKTAYYQVNKRWFINSVFNRIELIFNLLFRFMNWDHFNWYVKKKWRKKNNIFLVLALFELFPFLKKKKQKSLYDWKQLRKHVTTTEI